MKKHMLIAVCICGLAWTGIAASQDAESSKSQAPREQSTLEKPITLEFGGGTASQYVEAVRKASGDVNIVTMADLSDLSMPPVKLKSVAAYSALHLLEFIPREQPGRRVEVSVRPDGGIIAISSKVVLMDRQDARESLVISVVDLLDAKIKSADLLTAIEAALDMLKGQYEAAQIRFHESTGLIIARGHSEQMAAIQRVVDELREQIARKRGPEEAGQRAEAAMKNLEEAKSQLDRMHEQLEVASRQAMESQTRAEMLERELAQAQQAAQERETIMRHMMNTRTGPDQPQDNPPKPE